MTTTSGRVIRKDGLLYRLAYGKPKEEERPTGNVNLCDMIASALTSVLALIVLVVGLIVVCCCVAAIITLFGMALWHVGAVAIAWLTDPHLPSVDQGRLNLLVAFGSALAICFGVIATVVWGEPAFAKSETIRLITDYLRAKKEKICPIYEVVE